MGEIRRPLIGTSYPFVLAAGEMLHLNVHLVALDQSEIQLDAVPYHEPVG